MLPKKNRVSKKEVDLIFKQGKIITSPNLTFKYLKNQNKGIKISFIVPKNAAKLAVKRNLLRRRGYAALQNHLDQFPAGLMGVFIFKKRQENISIIEDEIKAILTKIN